MRRAFRAISEALLDLVFPPRCLACGEDPVPFVLADPDFKGAKLRAKGVLADVAPTALQVMGLPQPKEMKGLGLLLR